MSTEPRLPIATLRRSLRARRAALSEAQLAAHGKAAVAQILKHRWFRQATHIALYLPVGGELDLSALLAPAWARGKRLYLPVLAPFGGNRLWFAPFTPETTLVPNRFGIDEPDVSARAWRHPRHLDLVLTPLVGFDLSGHRLGMGGGYYDRSFAFRHYCSRSRPRLLGAAHALQQVEALPAQPWDVPLDGIVTELALHTIGNP